jgi:hypothetical protein
LGSELKDDKRNNQENDVKKQGTRHFAKTLKTIAISRSLIWLIVSLIVLFALSIRSSYLIDLGIPRLIVIASIVLLSMLSMIFLIQLKRAYSVSLAPKGTPDPFVIAQTETLIMGIPAIMRYDLSAGSYSILGTGKSFAPENAFLLTNENIWAVTVPVEGAGKVISNAEINKWNWTVGAKDIEERFKQMIESMSLKELILSCESHKRIANKDITWWKAEDRSHGIHFKTADGKKYAYAVRNLSDYKRLKDHFRKNICFE